jgi:arylsulfatase A-like enzyme
MSEFPERLLTARPGTDFDSAPVFCYMHLVPPHSPYDPGKAHDLWRNESYQGNIDGSYEVVMGLVSGKLDWNEADLERLVSLYDGNLHRADASAGRMIQYWKGLQRDRPLLVVILSDHGEAFAEHNHFTHNSTIYDEMIRIPLIIYPAEIAESLIPAREAMLALTDVMPLLLNSLRIKPPPGSKWPIRFLQVLEDPTAYRSCVLLRTTPAHRILGLRTQDYLAIFNGWRGQELYNMQRDPKAKINLRHEQYENYSELIGQMRAILEDRSGSLQTEASELSEEDLATLKSLGYI